MFKATFSEFFSAKVYGNCLWFQNQVDDMLEEHKLSSDRSRVKKLAHKFLYCVANYVGLNDNSNA